MEEGRCSGDMRLQGSDCGHGPCRGRARGAATPVPGEGTLQRGALQLGSGALGADRLHGLLQAQSSSGCSVSLFDYQRKLQQGLGKRSEPLLPGGSWKHLFKFAGRHRPGRSRALISCCAALARAWLFVVAPAAAPWVQAVSLE